MSYPTKRELFDFGHMLIAQFCVLNGLPLPEVFCIDSDNWQVRECAYYRPTYIKICLPKCAAIGVAAMAWSYPGNTVDRTPYGVLAHEVGHHADHTRSTRKGPYYGDFSMRLREKSGEPKLTNYCPNDGEWFAEMMRLFITNPDLLRMIRPRTYLYIRENFMPIECRTWQQVLQDAPERTIIAAQKKIDGVVTK